MLTRYRFIKYREKTIGLISNPKIRDEYLHRAAAVSHEINDAGEIFYQCLDEALYEIYKQLERIYTDHCL